MDAQHETSIMAYLHFLIYIKENQMRKILFNPTFEGTSKSFDFYNDHIVIKEEGKDLVKIKVSKQINNIDVFKYTAEELRQITLVNQHLDTPMTEEEIDFMLTNGITSLNIAPDDVAARAGYRIEKKIIPI